MCQRSSKEVSPALPYVPKIFECTATVADFVGQLLMLTALSKSFELVSFHGHFVIGECRMFVSLRTDVSEYPPQEYSKRR